MSEFALGLERRTIRVLDDAYREQLRYTCPRDPFATDWHAERHAFLAEHEMRAHLLDEHPDEIPYGRCAQCGTVTDHFHAVTEQGHMWGCEKCAPTPADFAVSNADG